MSDDFREKVIQAINARIDIYETKAARAAREDPERFIYSRWDKMCHTAEALEMLRDEIFPPPPDEQP